MYVGKDADLLNATLELTILFLSSYSSSTTHSSYTVSTLCRVRCVSTAFFELWCYSRLRSSANVELAQLTSLDHGVHDRVARALVGPEKRTVVEFAGVVQRDIDGS